MRQLLDAIVDLQWEKKEEKETREIGEKRASAIVYRTGRVTSERNGGYSLSSDFLSFPPPPPPDLNIFLCASMCRAHTKKYDAVQITS